MLKSIEFSGGFFENNTKMELFLNNDRLQSIYGKNGSGKSTLTNAILKAKGDDISDISCAHIFDENNEEITKTDNIYVFNERYIDEKVKISDDGLDTILLLGDLVGIEDKIKTVSEKKEEIAKRRESQEEKLKKYEKVDSPESPQYFLNKIVSKLSGDNGWAEREKLVKGNTRKSSITDKVRESIQELSVSDKENELRELFYDRLAFLNRVRGHSDVLVPKIEPLNINYNLEKIKMLLQRKIEKPTLSDREKYLFGLIENGDILHIEKMKKTFENPDISQCPFCLQEIESKYKYDLVKSIEKVLSKEVDEHKNELEHNRINKVEMDFTSVEVIESKHLVECKIIIEKINEEVCRINSEINRKLENPYESISDFISIFPELLQQYEDKRAMLEADIEKYNTALINIKKIEDEIREINKKLAHLEIKDFYESYKKVIDLQEKDKEKLTGIINDQSMVHNELELLNAKKKNIAVAEGQINRSLRYVFFSKGRLQIHAKNEKYCLYSYGKSVKPENVSVGERNIIALCYFFTEIISNHGIEDGYSQEMIIVIDDPVSSFDFENKVGIMSLLKYKLNKIMTNNKNSQIIVLTHDMQCMFDLQKIFQEICKEGDGVSFSGRELRNKRLDGFAFRSRHEYTELIKEMYNYASGEYEDKEYVIGNVMRRVLEAFSTFLYRKSIDEVSCDKKILAELEDNEYIEYFDNLMYRLVLHGESHMEERVKALEDIDYLEFISEDAKKRTAQEMICSPYGRQ